MNDEPDSELNKQQKGNQSGIQDANASRREEGDSQKKLSKEEQMARFEEQLKEEDWGHQPC